MIAYSTMSQIGYMFLAAGVGAYAAAMFHLAMHAFFKALLFMAAGIVIHFLAGEQDMRKMGGLKDHLPKTWLAFLIGSLALVGIPIFAGFWSKDPIIAAGLYDGGRGDGARRRGPDRRVPDRPLHVPDVLPRLVRRPLSRGARRRGAPTPRGRRRPGGARLAGRRARRPLHDRRLPAGAGRLDARQRLARPRRRAARPPAGVVRLADEPVRRGSLGLAGLYVAYLIYEAHRRNVPRWPELQRTLEHKLCFDELYDALFYRPAEAIAVWLRSDVETPYVEGSLVEIGRVGEEAGAGVARIQSGLLRTYALAITVTVVVLAIVFVSVR